MVLTYFIGNLHDGNIIRSLCIILPQMNGYIKYFDDGGKNVSFKTEDEDVYLEYNEIWNKIKKTLNTTFHSQPIYDDKYIKSKVKMFDGVINTLFSNNEICIDCNNAICIDWVLKMVGFIDAEVDVSSDDSDDSE